MTALALIDAETPLLALNVQKMLWSGYVSGQNIGISAMPSMHLATTTLMACYAFQNSRALGWAMVGFLAVILVGSVALGWHYAVDGYAGIALALVCWRLAAMALRRAHQGAPAGALPAGMPAE
jgi:membrane-associated phospholipid phosphatase